MYCSSLQSCFACNFYIFQLQWHISIFRSFLIFYTVNIQLMVLSDWMFRIVIMMVSDCAVIDSTNPTNSMVIIII